MYLRKIVGENENVDCVCAVCPWVLETSWCRFQIRVMNLFMIRATWEKKKRCSAHKYGCCSIRLSNSEILSRHRVVKWHNNSIPAELCCSEAWRAVHLRVLCHVKFDPNRAITCRMIRPSDTSYRNLIICGPGIFLIMSPPSSEPRHLFG